MLDSSLLQIPPPEGRKQALSLASSLWGTGMDHCPNFVEVHAGTLRETSPSLAVHGWELRGVLPSGDPGPTDVWGQDSSDRHTIGHWLLTFGFPV